MDARGAGVIDLAMGNGHLPAADVRNLARGKDARDAGVVDLARGKDARAPPPNGGFIWCSHS